MEATTAVPDEETPETVRHAVRKGGDGIAAMATELKPKMPEKDCRCAAPITRSAPLVAALLPLVDQLICSTWPGLILCPDKWFH